MTPPSLSADNTEYGFHVATLLHSYKRCCFQKVLSISASQRASAIENMSVSSLLSIQTCKLGSADAWLASDRRRGYRSFSQQVSWPTISGAALLQAADRCLPKGRCLQSEKPQQLEHQRLPSPLLCCCAGSTQCC